MLKVEENKESIVPFLKWAGGKRWLADGYLDLFCEDFNNYYEPFLGSGALFFRLLPKNAVLSDVNEELINTYKTIMSDSATLKKKLAVHHGNHSEDYYYRVRSSKPRSDSGRAARFIYLNRTCWNGLYRVNLKGEFNVPIGSKSNVILDSDDFEGISKALAGISIKSCDFEDTINLSGDGDFVFADPPYTVKHNKNGFIKYNESIFSWDDQIRLRDAVKRAVSRGAKVVVTNANHKCIFDLYSEIGDIYVLKRASVIAASSACRGDCEEVLIKCY